MQESPQKFSKASLSAFLKKAGYFSLSLGGIFFVVIGFLGLVLPILPGWIFIFLGLFLLGENHALSRFLLGKLPPKVRERFRR